ncbi:MAG: hypothetical protein V5A29_03165 [Haloarculaceae archaeon]
MLELLAVVLAKEADRAEVRLLICGKIAKSDVTFKQAVEFPRAADTDTVPEDEDFQHHHGMEGRPPAAVLPIVWIEGIEAALVIKMIGSCRKAL